MHQQFHLGLLGFPFQHTVHSVYWNSAAAAKLTESEFGEFKGEYKYASSAVEGDASSPYSKTVTVAPTCRIEADVDDW